MATDAFAQQGNLPNSPQFMAVMTACGAGSSFSFDGDLRRGAESVYERGRTAGKAVQEIVATIVERVPERDRVEAYKIYVDCIVQLSKDKEPRQMVASTAIPVSKMPQQGVEDADSKITNNSADGKSPRRIVRRISAYGSDKNLLCDEPGWRIGPSGIGQDWALFQEDALPSKSRTLLFAVGKPIELKDGCVLVLSEVTTGPVLRFDFIQTTWK
jgi:hypothetical protein